MASPDEPAPKDEPEGNPRPPREEIRRRPKDDYDDEPRGEAPRRRPARPPEDDYEDEPPAEAPRRRRPRPADDEDDEPRAEARRRPARRDDDYDEPRPRARRRDDDEDDDDEPRRRPARRRRDEDDEDDDAPADPITGLIPYKNPKSLVAYYSGVFGLIPVLGFILGPIAFIFGILAMRYSSRYPTARGAGHAMTGILLGVIDVFLWPLIVWIVWVLTAPPVAK